MITFLGLSPDLLLSQVPAPSSPPRLELSELTSSLASSSLHPHPVGPQVRDVFPQLWDCRLVLPVSYPALP